MIGVLVLSQDIGERVAAARVLADSERVQRSVLEVLDEGVLVVAPDGSLVSANPRACAILGFDLATAPTAPDRWKPVEAARPGDDAGLTVGAGGAQQRAGRPRRRPRRGAAGRDDRQAVGQLAPRRAEAAELRARALLERDTAGG